MYSTCLFCTAALGRNEMVEHFPIGRRLAFDAAHGRLWVVCRSCERWNLTPLEERWEAIEECERQYRDTRLRVSTDNIGLCRLRDGTELVRIGEPQRPEMAAWRYGDQFGKRRRKHMIMAGATAVAFGGYAIAGPVMGLVSAGAFNLFAIASSLWAKRTIARIPTSEGVFRINRPTLPRVALIPSYADQWGWVLEVPSYTPAWKWTGIVRDRPGVLLRGEEALRAAGVLLPHLNAGGGNQATVSSALELLDHVQSVPGMFARFAAAERKVHWNPTKSEAWKHSLGLLPPEHRLALEMALHESDERRALEGELAALEERWREAEEIAQISDDMFVPAPVREALARLSPMRPGPPGSI